MDKRAIQKTRNARFCACCGRPLIPQTGMILARIEHRNKYLAWKKEQQAFADMLAIQITHAIQEMEADGIPHEGVKLN